MEICEKNAQSPANEKGGLLRRNEKIFENEKFSITKKSFWKSFFGFSDGDWFSNLMNVSHILYHDKQFVGGVSAERLVEIFAMRVMELGFTELGYVRDGMVKFYIPERGYGYFDSDMNLVIEPRYAYAGDFYNGFAVVSYEDDKESDYPPPNCLFIDKQGREYRFGTADDPKQYSAVCDNSDNIFRVSDIRAAGITDERPYLELDLLQEADGVVPGFWGYADTSGREIIAPQYIDATDFTDGFALVCTGRWVKKHYKRSADYKYVQKGWKWGLIDTTGKEVVPCIFDKLDFLNAEENTGKYAHLLKALCGGYEKGKWGIVNYAGEWIVPPIFGSIDYNINKDGCIIFSNKSEIGEDVGCPQGIYSIPNQKILIDPIFEDIDYQTDGTLLVEEENYKTGDRRTKVIDFAGNEIFKSNYTALYGIYEDEYTREYCSGFPYFWSGSHQPPLWYITGILTKDMHWLKGLADRHGNEILPCIYDADSIFVIQRLIVFIENTKLGVMTFEGKIILPAIYADINDHQNLFLSVRIHGENVHTMTDENHIMDEEDKLPKKYGLIAFGGETILPVEYDSISIYDDLIIAESEDGTTLYSIERRICHG